MLYNSFYTSSGYFTFYIALFCYVSSFRRRMHVFELSVRLSQRGFRILSYKHVEEVACWCILAILRTNGHDPIIFLFLYYKFQLNENVRFPATF